MPHRDSSLHFPQKILLFWKKLGNMKTFSMQLVIKKAIIIFGSVARFFSLKTAVLRQQCAKKSPILRSNSPEIRRQNSVRLKCASRPSHNLFLQILLPSKFHPF